MIILLIIAFALIAFLDLPKLIKQKQWKDLAVFLFFFIFAFTVAFLHTIGIAIPSPIKGIQYVIKDILHLSYK